jgi:two-component system sensor histidine kinase RegB
MRIEEATMFIQGSIEEMVGTYNLKRLFVFRSAVIASELAAVGLAVYGLAVELPLLYMLSVIGLYTLFNAYICQ